MDAEKILIISLMLFVVGLVLSISDGPKKKAPPPDPLEYDRKLEAIRQRALLGCAEFYDLPPAQLGDPDKPYRIRVFGGDFVPENVGMDEYYALIEREKAKGA
jgi:hypothetical protein